MVLPQGVLRAAARGPVLVELKNGDSYSGTLVATDNVMNIRLEDAVFTPRAEQKFEKLKECTIRGQFVKFVRFPDDILDKVVAQQQAADAVAAGSGKWRGRSRGHGEGKGSRGRGGAPPLLTEKLVVPANVVGAIIGRGGETVKRLSDDSGARIEVAKDAQRGTPGESGERSILLTGAPDCVAHAKALIDEMVRSGLGRDQWGSGRPRGGRGGKGAPRHQ